MGAGNVKAVFDRYATQLPWRPFAALVFMANTSLDADPWPYYSAGLDHLTAVLFKTPDPSATQLRDVRRLVRGMVDDQVITKDREASSLRKNARDRSARYRLNIHDAADLARKQWEADITGVSDPCAVEASSGVSDPPTTAASTGVSDPASTGVSDPRNASQQGGLRPLLGVLDLEEQQEEEARATAPGSAAGTPAEQNEPQPEALKDRQSNGPHVPPKPDLNVSMRCPRHRNSISDEPCRACGEARRAAEATQARNQAALVSWENTYQQWKRWRDKQPTCPDEKPGGNITDPITGVAACPMCRRRTNQETR
ncbi:hypothetical protein [Actinoplanes sp. NPDC051494]|uniref:hypothetical protein n=1 Tax=Actinoplanes sp. NPDC051494 TaxID=3363907 RepID=UPI0037A80507